MTDNSTEDTFCPSCGASLAANSQFCPECGTEVDSAGAGAGGDSGTAGGTAAVPDADPGDDLETDESTVGLTDWAIGFAPGSTLRNVFVAVLYFLFWPFGLALLVIGFLRRDGTDPRARKLGRIAAYAVGAFFVLGGVAGLATADGVVTAAIFLVLGLFLVPPLRERLERRSGVSIGPAAVLVVVLVGLVAAGATAPASDSPASNQMDDSAGQAQTATQAGGSSSDGSDGSDSTSGTSSDAEIQVRISYGGAWSGSVGTAGKTQSFDGTGSGTITISGDPEVVSAAIQKQQADGQLVVQIVVDGEVVKEGQTSADYGVVTISADIDDWF